MRGLCHIHLENFRNYSLLDCAVPLKPIVLIGKNGAGKTNILEALSLLSPGRGLRGSKLGDISRSANPDRGWTVTAELTLDAVTITLGTGLEKTRKERRLIAINGSPATKQTSLAEWLSVIWITPQMGRLFIDGTSQRRKFIDRLVFSVERSFLEHWQRYEHLLVERSKCLRQGYFDHNWLNQLEAQLAETAVSITAIRTKTLAIVENNQPSHSPFPSFFIKMVGLWEELVHQEGEGAREILRETLQKNRYIDSEIGGSRIGPHRSDFLLIQAAQSLPASFCSTGEQKMLLLGLLLAFIRLQKEHQDFIGERAILLLIDDIAAHLDACHRQLLFEEVLSLNVQAWLTGTDADVFSTLQKQAHVMQVADGAVYA